MNLAPIALFVYSRPWHTRQTVTALQKNDLSKESSLFVFSDGPRFERDRKNVMAVREYINQIKGFKSVTVVEREVNFGLARSIISGVTEIVNRYGKIIVLEDDIIVSPYFLKFMNEALEFYQEEHKVISIHGYIYPMKIRPPETFFIRGTDCWGWATWKRGWDLFEPDGRKLLNELKRGRLEKKFDINGAYPFTKMLKNQIRRKNDSWAVRWYASAFLNDKLTLYPGRSLAQNIGFDNSGTHCYGTNVLDTEISGEPIPLKPIPIEENVVVLKGIEEYLRSIKFAFLKQIPSGCFIKIKQYVLKEQFEPRFPALFLNPFFFARKGLFENISLLAKYINGKTLDVGCGQKPYEKLFNSTQYIGLEIDSPENRRNKRADFFYNGNTFPFQDNEFDSVVANEVFEHVFNPLDFLGEIKRVLRPGGMLLMTVPFVWDEHEQPNDYARYTSFGLRHLLESNGFEVIEHKKSIHDIRVIFQLFNDYIYKVTVTRNIYINLFLVLLLMSPVNILGAIFARILPKNDDLYLDNIILARKV